MIENFLIENFPSVQLHAISELTGNESLILTTANQGALGVKGVVILDFAVEKGHKLFQIPFLVTTQ